MTATLPVYNLNSPIAEIKQGPGGKLQAYLISPWNSFFQQFVQPAPQVVNVSLTASPFSLTPNSNGTVIVTGGTISNISLIRGTVTINLTGQRIIPMSLNDTLRITYSVAPQVQFLGA